MSKGIWGIENHLLQGDAITPTDTDLIAQLGMLDVGEPVPEGWRVLSGNALFSSVGRVAYRYEIEEGQ